MSLSEVLVAMGLAFLLLGLCVEVLIPCLRAQTEGTLASKMQEQGSLALVRLNEQLQTTGGEGLSLHNSNPLSGETYPDDYADQYPIVVSAIPIVKANADTSLEWSLTPVATAYDRPHGQLLNLQWPAGHGPGLSVHLAASQPARLPDADLLSLPGARPTARQTCQDVSYFDISSDNGHGYPLGQNLTVTLVLRSGGQSFRLQRRLAMRNSG